MNKLSKIAATARSLLYSVMAMASALAGLLLTTAADISAATNLTVDYLYPYDAEGEGVNVSPGIDRAYVDFTIAAGTQLTVGSGTVKLSKGNTTVSSWTVSGSPTGNIYVEGNRLYIAFDSPLETLGDTYTLSLPAGIVNGFTTIDADGNDIPQTAASNEARTIKFTLAYLTLTSSTPAEGALLPSFPAVSSARFNFQFGTGSDEYGTLHYDASKLITLTKDGQAYASWPASKEAGHIRPTTGYPDSFTIDFGQELPAGSYVLSVPRGIFSGTGLSNGPLTLHFTLTRALSYAVTPSPGNSASKSAMSHVTLTYPATSAITVKSGASATLTFVKNSGTETIPDVSYNLSASGNVLTLSCDPAAITASSSAINVNWFKINIPAGSFTVVDSGDTFTNDIIELAPYQISAIAASDLTFTPSLTQKGLTAEDLRNITLQLGEGLSWANAADLNPGAANPGTLLFVSASPYDQQFNLQYKLAAVSGDKKTLTLQLKDTKDLSNYTEKFPEGQTVIRIYAGKIQDTSGAKNTQMDITAWDLEGVTNAVTYKTVPADGEVVTAGSISNLELYFTRPIEVADVNAQITLTSKNGGTIKQVRVSDATITTGAPRTAKFTDLFGNNTENDEYTFTVPAGAFREKATGWLNEEMVITCTKQGDFVWSDITPSICTFSGTAAKPVANPGEAREYYQKFVITYPVAADIKLTSDYASKLTSCAFGETAIANGFNNNETIIPTAKGGITVTSAEVNGNQLILTLSGKYKVPTPSDQILCLRVAEGIIDMIGYTDGAQVRKVNPATNFYFNGLDGAANTVGGITLTSPALTCTASEMGSITLTSANNEVLYFADQFKYWGSYYGGFTATLYNSSGGVASTYTLNTCAKTTSVTATGGSTTLAPGIYTLKPSYEEANRLYTGAQPQRKNAISKEIIYTDCNPVAQLEYTITVVESMTPWDKAKLTATAPATSFDKNAYPAGPTLFTWTLNSDDPISVDWSKSVSLQAPDGQIVEIPVSNDYGYFSYNVAEKRMTLDLSKHEKAATLMAKYGKYTLTFPADIFSMKYIKNAALAYEYTYNRIVDKTYIIRPADKAELESGGLNEITVSFPKADDDITLTYDTNKPAKLTDGSGNTVTATPTVEGKTLKFNFDNIAAGNYTFTIDAEAITLTASEGIYPVATAITASYTVKEADVCAGNLADHITLDIPAALNCDRASTTTIFQSYGMGLISLGLDLPGMTINTACAEKVYLVRDGSVVSSIRCDETPEKVEIARIMVTDFSMTESAVGGGSDITGGAAQQYLMMLFDETIYDYAGGADNFRVPGTYTLTIPDGAVKLEDGTLLHGVTLNYIYDDSEKIFKYTLSPDPAKASPLQPKEYFANITVNFKDDADGAATNVKLATCLNDVMTGGFTLSDAQGTSIPLGAEPATNGENNLTLTFGTPSTDWSALQAPFTLTIEPGYVSVNSPYWNNDFDAGATPDGNFKGLTATYAGPFGVELPELSAHATLSFPSSFFCDKLMTTSDTFSSFGMLFVGLGIDTDAISVNRSCTTPVTMSYEGRVIGSIVCSDESFFGLVDSGQLWQNPELTGGPTVKDLFMVFDEYLYDETADHSAFQADGVYTVVIPVGAMLITENGETKEMNGLTLEYHYTNGMFNLADLDWEISPAFGNEVNILDPQEDFDTVRITFPKAQFVNFKQNWQELDESVTLTCPVAQNVFDIDGDQYDANMPCETIRPLSIEKDPEFENVVIFKFREHNPYRDWDGDGKPDGPFPAQQTQKRVIRRTNIVGTPDRKYQDLERYGDGQYTLNVPAGMLSIDSPEWINDGTTDGNVPAVSVTYTSDRTSVPTDIEAIYGDDNRYTVVTPDGKVIRRDVKHQDLRDLEPGIYLINGRKVCLTR